MVASENSLGTVHNMEKLPAWKRPEPDSRSVWLTVSDLMVRWSCSRSHVYVVLEQPDFPTAVLFGKRTLRFLRDDIEAWESSHTFTKKGDRDA